jgi:hypothetical protein
MAATCWYKAGHDSGTVRLCRHRLPLASHRALISTADIACCSGSEKQSSLCKSRPRINAALRGRNLAKDLKLASWPGGRWQAATRAAFMVLLHSSSTLARTPLLAHSSLQSTRLVCMALCCSSRSHGGCTSACKASISLLHACGPSRCHGRRCMVTCEQDCCYKMRPDPACKATAMSLLSCYVQQLSLSHSIPYSNKLQSSPLFQTLEH